MKAFFEEYGFVLVSIVVVMMLVAMVPTVGGAIEGKLSDVAENITVDLNATNPTVTIEEKE